MFKVISFFNVKLLGLSVNIRLKFREGNIGWLGRDILYWDKRSFGKRGR